MSTSTIGLVLLLCVFGCVLLLFWSRRRSATRLARYLARNGFVERGEAIPRAFLAEDMGSIQVFTGRLAPDLAAQLYFGRRRSGSSMINNVDVVEIEEHFAIHIPQPRPMPDRPWIERWRADPGARGEVPQRVVVTLQSGLLLNWRCAIDERSIANASTRSERPGLPHDRMRPRPQNPPRRPLTPSRRRRHPQPPHPHLVRSRNFSRAFRPSSAEASPLPSGWPIR